MGSQSVPNYTPYMFDPNVRGMTPVTQEYPTLRPFPYGSMGVDYNNWLGAVWARGGRGGGGGGGRACHRQWSQ